MIELKYYQIIVLSKAYHLEKYLHKCDELGCSIYDGDPVLQYIKELDLISSKLDYEEAEHLGFSEYASHLRKEWRAKCRQIKRTLKQYIRNRASYNREWSKPRKRYIFAETGEVHNGLWFTIKAYISLKILGVHSIKPERYED